ncbi:MAG TPA: hypothetical protein VD735_00495 [Candidatus Saccharimonadales bacterium]|nr:hypothetical protein [Candidatus Saccharimonadales bacterium]
METLQSVWKWLLDRHPTIDDGVFYVLHLVLAGVFVYSLYHQFVHARWVKVVQAVRRRAAMRLRRMREWIHLKADQALHAIKLRLHPPKPGSSQNIRPHGASMVLATDSVSIQIKRGPLFWSYASLAWSAFSVLYIEVVSNYHRLDEASFTSLIAVIDLAVIFWLCFFSRWFRNKIAGFVAYRERTPD